MPTVSSWRRKGEVDPDSGVDPDLAGRLETGGVRTPPFNSAGSGGDLESTAVKLQRLCAGSVELILHLDPVGVEDIGIKEDLHLP